MMISLKAARANANLTQAEVAKHVHKSKQTIVNWEKGKTFIDEGNFKLLCDLYKMPSDNIFLPYKSTNRRLNKADTA